MKLLHRLAIFFWGGREIQITKVYERMASSGRLSDEIQRLAALVEQTSADLSSARATRATAAIRQHRSGSRLGATATLTPGDGAAASADGQSVRGMDSARLALPTKNAIALTDLRRDLDERARRVDELVMLIEGDVRAIKREHGEAMDGTRRVDARLDRLVQTVGVVEAAAEGDVRAGAGTANAGRSGHDYFGVRDARHDVHKDEIRCPTRDCF